MNKCRICNNSNNNKIHVIREMMFDCRETFEYFECSNCDCLQIKEFPSDLSKYYPPNYLSFAKPHLPKLLFATSLIKRQRLLNALGQKSPVGFILSRLFGTTSLPEWIKKVKVKPDSSILDVGCGIGRLLLRLRRKGFSNLTGIDPFIKDDIFYKCGVKILKKYIKDMEEEFELIMLHHSFEHMPNPLFVLNKLYCLLKPGHFVLVRIPTVSSFAWRKYKTNWFQLDAPRHLFLHSTKSIQLLADKAGFRVTDITYDSKAIQFWRSEQYAKCTKLKDEQAHIIDLNKIVFSKKELKQFEEEAKKLNEKNDGDQACFFLYKQ
jgi:2-polyprenyl-3-methyl-5-hydroxy-6-metoxy-1,4-benzoquinol methylase